MAVKWRNETFYTIGVCKDGSKKAFRQSGFSDGRFNYYEAPDGTWFAVLPDYGLSVASGETRAKCRNAALKVDVPSEDEMSDEQWELIHEAKMLIYEKIAFRLS